MITVLAWRNIWRNKARSIIIIFSIALGLFAGILVLSLYKGMMKSRIRTVVDAEIGHLQLHNPGFKDDNEPQFIIRKGSNILAEIKHLPEVKLSAQRSVTNGMLTTPTGSAGVKINGVEPELEYKVSRLDEKIIEGGQFKSGKKNQVIIGKKVATKMNCAMF